MIRRARLNCLAANASARGSTRKDVRVPLPDPARYARDAAEAIGAAFEDLDQGGGYLFRVSKNGRFVLAGAGAVCAFPVNAATAFTISRDKAHSKAALLDAGLPVIPGGLFFSHDRQISLRGPGCEAADAIAFAERLGYPVFCKPNMGSRGNYAEIVADSAGLADYISRVSADFETFLVEPIIRGVEHRVLVFDNRAIFHSVKREPFLEGDGASTVHDLLAAHNDSARVAGVSPYPAFGLGDVARIPVAGERISLPGRRNLSAAGGIEEGGPNAPHALEELAIAAARAIGLRLAAVDLFDTSPNADLSDLVIIEINGNPGLRTLEATGHDEVIRSLWVAMLNDRLGG